MKFNCFDQRGTLAQALRGLSAIAGLPC